MATGDSRHFLCELKRIAATLYIWMLVNESLAPLLLALCVLLDVRY